MATLTKTELEAAITNSVQNRIMAYNSSFALSIHWQLDNTNATEDADHFQSIFSTLNLPQSRSPGPYHGR
ncbi:hypothetical protein NUU61_008801 [Penicillium alfredii]|uniref:Uncharacterized protein n=1 Tax=Penicillium alfredii TaxID=1506179 RepID=A0A9W9ELU5_9EURO|nr:uncharacterized protein NUU61_008801 [Penicillium alfredii]KAJ5084222.1 hypothetical protein NUU61_008801 [Penicillium alfredii]